MSTKSTSQHNNALVATQHKEQPSRPVEQAASHGHETELSPTTARDSVSSNWHNLDNRLAMIAEAAYFKAEKRGFAVGHEIADWLEAEQELAEIMGER